MRKLDPKARLTPGDGSSTIARWDPRPFSLHLHRLGLTAMAGQGHLLVSAGKTGSVKLWPETALRCAADAAGVLGVRSARRSDSWCMLTFSMHSSLSHLLTPHSAA